MMESRSFTATPNCFRIKDDMRAETWCFRGVDNKCLLHYHQCIELVYVTSGVMDALIDGEMFSVHEGELLLCSSYAVHSYSTPAGMHNHIICALFPLNFMPVMRSTFKQHCFSQIVLKNPESEIIWGLECLANRDETLTPETKRSLSQFVLGMLVDTVGLTQQCFSDTSNIIRSILVYLQSNFMQSITLSDLAREVNYSQSRLSHLFHDYFHCTYTEYLNSLRCRHALQLLKEDTLTVLEISGAAGFDSVRTFYRAFQRMYGMPPLKYKKALDERKHQASLKA